VKYKSADIDDLYLSVSKLTTHEYDKNNKINPKPLFRATGFFYKGTDKA